MAVRRRPAREAPGQHFLRSRRLAADLVYDAPGNLRSRLTTSPARTTRYLLDDLFETDGNNTITTTYVDGPAGDLAAYQGPPVTNTPVSYLYYSGHGDLAAEADTNGNATNNQRYDPFGAPLVSQPQNTTAHRFTGRWDKQYDTTSGLVLMGARPYDPATGRFLAVDPIDGGSLNNYDYAGQDPINGYDLDGLTFIDEGSLNRPLGFIGFSQADRAAFAGAARELAARRVAQQTFVADSAKAVVAAVGRVGNLSAETARAIRELARMRGGRSIMTRFAIEEFHHLETANQRTLTMAFRSLARIASFARRVTNFGGPR